VIEVSEDDQPLSTHMIVIIVLIVVLVPVVLIIIAKLLEKRFGYKPAPKIIDSKED
jgi:hypothetical protein